MRRQGELIRPRVSARLVWLFERRLFEVDADLHIDDCVDGNCPRSSAASRANSRAWRRRTRDTGNLAGSAALFRDRQRPSETPCRPPYWRCSHGTLAPGSNARYLCSLRQDDLPRVRPALLSATATGDGTHGTARLHRRAPRRGRNVRLAQCHSTLLGGDSVRASAWAGVASAYGKAELWT